MDAIPGGAGRLLTPCAVVQGYHLPAEVVALARLPEPLPAGIPSEREYVQMYCQQRGTSPPGPQVWAFYVALALFRAAAILAGVHTRALQGNASAADAKQVGRPEAVDAMARHALQQLQDPEAQTASEEQAESRALQRPGLSSRELTCRLLLAQAPLWCTAGADACSHVEPACSVAGVLPQRVWSWLGMVHVDVAWCMLSAPCKQMQHTWLPQLVRGS